MMLALTIIHVIISLTLVVIVLMQHGKQQGLSGAIAGGAETFFGKNKGRTIDAMLKKFTTVVAILFIISSVTFAAVAINTYNKENTDAVATTQTEDADGLASVTMDEDGNLVDADGNIVMTAEEVAQAQAEAQTEGATDAETETEAEAEAPAEETPAE